MTLTSLLKLSPLLLAFWGTAAVAQAQGTTTGPAYGNDVAPNTATQKQHEGRPGATGDNWKASSKAAGSPGIEGKPGTEGGPKAQQKAVPPSAK